MIDVMLGIKSYSLTAKMKAKSATIIDNLWKTTVAGLA